MSDEKQGGGTSGTEELVRRLKAVQVKDIMTREVTTTRANVKLGELAAVISKARISGLPVVDGEGKIIGMITATDLFSLMTLIMDGNAVEEGKTGLCNPSVKFAMSSVAVTIGPDATLHEVIGIMSRKKIHTLPVVEAGKIVGVVGRHDAFKYFYSIINEIDKENNPAGK